MNNLIPVEGCPGCQGTGGALSCPQHSPVLNPILNIKPLPFAKLSLHCPWCGKGMEFDCFKVEITERKII
jgi:hypothetical protein